MACDSCDMGHNTALDTETRLLIIHAAATTTQTPRPPQRPTTCRHFLSALRDVRANRDSPKLMFDVRCGHNRTSHLHASLCSLKYHCNGVTTWLMKCEKTVQRYLLAATENIRRCPRLWPGLRLGLGAGLMSWRFQLDLDMELELRSGDR